MVLIAYCTGLIIICTALLVVATSVSIKNYWLLRDLADSSPGKHENVPAAKERQRQNIAYYDSDGPSTPAQPIEWTGPVTPYTPANREA